MDNCKDSGQQGLAFEMIGPRAHEILKSRSCKSLCSNLPICSQLVIKRRGTQRERDTHGSGMSDTTGLLFPAKRWTNGVPWSRLEQLLSTSACVRPLRRATIPPWTAFFLAVSSAPILPLLNGGIFHFFTTHIFLSMAVAAQLSFPVLATTSGAGRVSTTQSRQWPLPPAVNLFDRLGQQALQTALQNHLNDYWWF